jgi:hypothetical protein
MFLGVCSGEGASLEEKRRSNGCKAPGRWIRDVERCEAALLLPGEDSTDSYSIFNGGLLAKEYALFT